MDLDASGHALVGGALIGAAASLLLAANGRVAGISGIALGLLTPTRGEVRWRVAFVVGLLAAGALAAAALPGQVGRSPRALPWVVVAGLLVGVGTRLGNGCTSGHGVCGVARRSPRSIVATATFMATGVVTAVLARLLGGAS
jgi:uncharacterized membrane protein YedE/YeeE